MTSAPRGTFTDYSQILERDPEAKEKAPQVIKEEMNDTKASAADNTSFANLLALGQMHNIASGGHGTDPVNMADGHKFGLPDLPLPADGNLKYRYDPVVSQVTTLLMKHGKLSVAQRVGPLVLYFPSAVLSCADLQNLHANVGF